MFLKSSAEAILGPEEIKKITTEAAIILKETGLIEEAATLFRENGDWHGLIQLILSEAPALVDQGRYCTLFDWLSYIPKGMVKSNTWCLYWMGVCRMPVDIAESRYFFEQSFEAFTRGKIRTGALIAWSGAVETIFFERGDFTRMDKWYEAINGLLKEPFTFSSADIEVAVVRGMVEIILSRTTCHPGIGIWLKKAMDLIGSDIPLEKKLAIANPLQLYFIYSGDYISALELLSILKHTVDLSKASPLAQIRWHLIEAVHAHMTVEAISDSLWPDSTGDLARRSFDITLHRLRNLIRNNDVIQFNKGKITLDPQYCSVDVWAFQRIAGMIREILQEAQSHDTTEKIIALSETAIGIYRGDFLASEEAYPWALSAKERLRNRFVSLIKTAGKCLQDSGQYEKAADYYKKALETDSLDEGLYRRLMLCYQRLGNNAKAVSVYNSCRDTLLDILGIKPSADTEAAIKSILNNG
jgi:DNA-binding SARP family transcriptional activator